MKRRLLLFGFALALLFMFLIVRFYVIQIVEQEKWTKQARRQHFFAVQEPFSRGTFFSQSKNPAKEPQKLVFDLLKYHLFVDPKVLLEEEKETIAHELSEKLNLSVAEELFICQQLHKESRSRKLKMWLNKEQRDLLLAWWNPYARQHRLARNALFFVADYQRSYPFGALLGQILHTVQAQRDPITLQAMPTGGLELSFHQYLQGEPGKRLLMRSPRHAFETGSVMTEPKNGADIYLTIDHCLQAIAEEELEKGVKRSGAKAGWVAMMDPYTGEILALAHYPFFSPATYRTYFNDPTLIEHTRAKALTDAYEPGSVMKPLTLAIALKANQELLAKGKEPLFDPEEKISTSGGRFHGRKKPIKDLRLHYYLNMDMALQKSSNVYLARLMEGVVDKLGSAWYREQLVDLFGFGKKTGIELPSEHQGLVPRIGHTHPNGRLEWSQATPYSLAFGHNIQANTLQILSAYSVILNGGYRVQPTCISKIVRGDELLFDNSVREKGPHVLDESIAKRVVQALKYVTKPGGSGTRADIRGYTEGGKSGTSEKVINGQYSKTKNVSSFIGFSPADKPAFVLIASMDEPEHGYLVGIGKLQMGGMCAAPVVRTIAQRALAYLAIPPDDPYGYPVGDPRRDAEKADWVKENRVLQEMYETWNIPN